MSRSLLFASILLFFVLFFFLPIGSVYVEAFRDLPAGSIFARLSEVIRSPRTGGIVAFTVGQAGLSALIGVVVALPVAFVVSHYEFPGRRFVYSLSLIPFVLPSIIVVVCMISFYGKNGLVNNLLGTDANLVYNFRGIVLAHVFYNFSLAIRVIANSWCSIDRRYREAAESLGERRLGLFFRVTLPLLAPAMLSGFLLIFIYCFLSFGIILVFGGIQFATLEVAIYQEMFIDLDLVSAATYSLLQLAISLGFVILSTRAINATRTSRVSSEAELPRLATASPALRAVLWLYLLVAVIFVLGPLLTMTARAFTDGSGLPSLENFRQLIVPGAAERNVESILRSSLSGVIARSIGIAAASGTLVFAAAAGLALALRDRRGFGFESFLQLPIGMSLVTVSLGLRFVWDGIIPPVALIVVGQFFIAFPLVFRIVRTGVAELGAGPAMAAQILGASRWAVFRDIEAPLLKRTFLNAYAYALALPFADLTVVLAAGRGRIATFPVAIYRLIGFRSFDLALALAVIYIAICLGLFIVIDRTSLTSASLTSASPETEGGAA